MRRLLAHSVVAVLGFSALLGGVRMVGGMVIPPSVKALDPGTCLPPCWHGIRPGETSFAQAEAMLRADPSLSLSVSPRRTLCWIGQTEAAWPGCIRSWQAGGPVEDVELYLPDNALRLGDALVVFGDPTSVRLCWIVGYSNRFVLAMFYFEENIQLAAYSPRHPTRWQIDPEMSVIQVFYLTADSARLEPAAPPWRGLTSSVQKGCGEQ